MDYGCGDGGGVVGVAVNVGESTVLPIMTLRILIMIYNKNRRAHRKGKMSRVRIWVIVKWRNLMRSKKKGLPYKYHDGKVASFNIEKKFGRGYFDRIKALESFELIISTQTKFDPDWNHEITELGKDIIDLYKKEKTEKFFSITVKFLVDFFALAVAIAALIISAKKC